jgi:uncharacterized membrane protein YjgN (DUF898 family)
MIDTTGGEYSSQTLARPPGSPPVHRFEYDGRLGPLFWLFIKNLLLSIVTFGIYRFWGRTNIRRYIWSNTRFLGDTLEYTGKGSELFAGFLIVFGILFVVSAAVNIIVVGLGPESPVALILNIVFPIFIGYFVFVAQYAAQRYRLTRTVWRGLRGGMTGSAWSYGAYAFGVTLLTGLTLTIARPWARARLIERRLSNSYFGDAKITVAFSSRPLFPSYLAGLATFLVGAGLIGYLVYVALSGTDIVDRFTELFAMNGADGSGGSSDGGSSDETGSRKTTKAADEAEIAQLVFTVLGLYVLVAVVLLVYSAICFAWFDAATARVTAANATFQDLHFGSSASGGQIAWLVASNFLLILFTLYFAYPVVVQRTIRFVTRHCLVYGTLDVERLRQTTLVKSKTGEGLLEVFDPGMF